MSPQAERYRWLVRRRDKLCAIIDACDNEADGIEKEMAQIKEQLANEEREFVEEEDQLKDGLLL